MAPLEPGAGNARIEVREGSGAFVVALHGEFDLANADELAQVLATCPPDTGLVIDMTHLRFMDSSVIAVLVEVATSGRTIRLRHPSELISQVIAATGLTELLPADG